MSSDKSSFKVGDLVVVVQVPVPTDSHLLGLVGKIIPHPPSSAFLKIEALSECPLKTSYWYPGELKHSREKKYKKIQGR